MSYAFPTLGAAVAIAGSDKLAGFGGYNRMFRHLGWSRRAMHVAAATETAGGLLMVAPATRRYGGLLVSGVSAVLLVSELRHHDPKLAVPRGLVLLAGLAALFAPHRDAT